MLGVLLSSAAVFAQMPVPYGAPITGDAAKKFAAGRSLKREEQMVHGGAIVDPQATSCSSRKLRTHRAPRDHRGRQGEVGGAVQASDQSAAGRALRGRGDGLRILGFSGAVPVEGGRADLMDGKIVGAIGYRAGRASKTVSARKRVAAAKS